MGVIKVSHLKPEMFVCNDVKDRNGRLLVAAGTRLTDKHIRIIKIWGVVEADIRDASDRDADPPAQGPVDPDIGGAADEVVTKNFRYNDLQDPAIAELYKISRRRKALEMAEIPSSWPITLSVSRSSI